MLEKLPCNRRLIRTVASGESLDTCGRSVYTTDNDTSPFSNSSNPSFRRCGFYNRRVPCLSLAQQ
jgi:hypothetical protein